MWMEMVMNSENYYFSSMCAISASIVTSACSNCVCWSRFDLYQQIVWSKSWKTPTKCGTRSSMKTERCWINPKHNEHICSNKCAKTLESNDSASIFLILISAINESISSINSTDTGVYGSEQKQKWNKVFGWKNLMENGQEKNSVVC